LQVNPTTIKNIAVVAATANNTNGCPIPITWFTRSQFSTCPSIRARYQSGDEFASHAVKHIRLSMTTRENDMITEVIGARDYLYKKCGLPVGSVKGYRAAYRSSNPRVRQVKRENIIILTFSFPALMF
jgi:peptidoglycan/xylan/chitin deacetylase (PgdA/CDA1 family)